MSDGHRESEQSWLELLLDLERRGLTASPELATGDGALGFWKALRQVWRAADYRRAPLREELPLKPHYAGK